MSDKFEWAPSLHPIHTLKCKVYPDRKDMFRKLTADALVGAEVGVQGGFFSQFILETLNLDTLYLLDIDLSQINHKENYLIAERAESGTVVYLEGWSDKTLKSIPDASLDFIYVDGGHNYDVVKSDLEHARRVIVPGGIIICNDYTQYSPIEQAPYGVMKAVNEMCLEQNYELIGLALQGAGYHDVALRKIGW